MKKQLLSFMVITLVGTSFNAIGQMDHSKMNHGKKMEMNKSGRKSIDAKTKKEVLKVLKLNEQVHSSFFDYDGKKVEANAKALNDAIKSISNADIAKLLKFSTTKLDAIKDSNERASNDQAYHLVSMALIHIVNTYDVGSEYNAYSCPMVKKKWLQNSKKMAKVHNPYAPNMPHCGGQDTSY